MFRVFALVAVAPLFAFPPQAERPPVSFAVESIKPASVPVGREGGNRSRIQHTPVSLSLFNVSVTDCVQWAYDLPQFQVDGAHARPDTYDILARTGAPATVPQLRAMLLELLKRRFQLAVHRETRRLPVYELEVAKGGAKLPGRLEDAPGHVSESLPRVDGGAFVFAGVTLAEFGQMLSELRGIEVPVIDRTRLGGAYDIVLKGAPAAARDGDTTALLRIIEEQTGVKLVARKAPTEVVVIDRSEKPSQN